MCGYVGLEAQNRFVNRSFWNCIFEKTIPSGMHGMRAYTKKRYQNDINATTGKNTLFLFVLLNVEV